MEPRPRPRRLACTTPPQPTLPHVRIMQMRRRARKVERKQSSRKRERNQEDKREEDLTGGCVHGPHNESARGEHRQVRVTAEIRELVGRERGEKGSRDSACSARTVFFAHTVRMKQNSCCLSDIVTLRGRTRRNSIQHRLQKEGADEEASVLLEAQRQRFGENERRMEKNRRGMRTHVAPRPLSKPKMRLEFRTSSSSREALLCTRTDPRLQPQRQVFCGRGQSASKR
ncbi:hypothetical protein K438DRAFT_414329 [Mycena galopus ATCC 62051]|nr:hypothetical protein K438DRAFT_414329 [Mycena galopus ATCC 62051]